VYVNIVNSEFTHNKHKHTCTHTHMHTLLQRVHRKPFDLEDSSYMRVKGLGDPTKVKLSSLLDRKKNDKY